MKALYFDGQAQFGTDYPVPEPQPGESLIRILVAAICNTDREVMRGYKAGFSGVLGHEFVGVVEQSTDPALVGKRVVGELNAGCGTCFYCQTSRQHHCENRKIIGMQQKDGCFAQYMTLRTDLLHVVPDHLPDEQAIYCEPLAAALEIVERSHLRPSQPVAVIGDGRLAFLIAQTIALNGTPVTVFGHHADKLEMFRPFATTALAPEGSFEVVVEASGSPGGLSDAMALVRSQGLLVLKSTYAGQPNVDMSQLVVREITIQGSRCGPFVPALNLLSANKVILPSIQLYRLEDYQEAFASKAFKVGFDLR